MLVPATAVEAERKASEAELILPQAPRDIVTVKDIALLTVAVTERFADMKKELERQMDASRKVSREEHNATLAKLDVLEEGTSGVAGKITALQDIQEELDSVKNDREIERRRLMSLTDKIAETLIEFDSGRINCSRCGKGFTDGFARELLTLHSEIIRQLGQIKSRPDSESLQ